ncbi:SusD/RagB family nutrient-binding outer membrane lipoprotein [Marinilabiliaceae bacterium JC017]|nr:SusD/RagB family nutrient-binding outer membrane lipoprotein [Marinilabiliaceae bacterium JC017]
MKIYKYFIVVLFALGIASCTDDFKDINKDPSAISADNIAAKYFITKAQVRLMAPDRYPYWRAHIIHVDRYAGHFCFGFAGSWWDDELGYKYHGGYTDAAWNWLEEYTGTLVTYLQLTEEGGDLENPLAYATALILRSLYFGYYTDTFGEIPYSETGDLSVLLPKFDTQKDIYEGMIVDLNRAIELIGSNTSTGELDEDLGDNDLFYGGDLQKWKKFANTLKLRIALRALGAEGADFAQTAITEALGEALLSGEDDNAFLQKDIDIDQWNSAAYGDVFYNFGTGSDWTVSNYVVNSLQKNGDPRLSKYARPAVGGETTIPKPEADSDELYQSRKNFILAALDDAGAVYTESTNDKGEAVITMDEDTYYVGQPVRLNPEMQNYARYDFFSRPAEYIIQAKNQGKDIAPEIVLTTAEAYFLQAEAIVRGAGSGNANALYREGIKQAMLLWDVEQTAIDEFLANSPMANLDGSNDLEKIATQRWLAYYTEGFQAWAVVRKLGFPADLAAGVEDGTIFGLGDLNGLYPRRMRYGSGAYSKNNENLQEALQRQGEDKQGTTLWWAKSK